MKNISKMIEENIPFYEISNKIKKQYFEEYDSRFYKYIQFCNIAASFVFTFLAGFEVQNEISSIFYIFDIIFGLVGIFVIIGVIYAHFKK